MDDKQPEGHEQAMRWFDALEPMPQAFALGEIDKSHMVMLVAGNVTRGIERHEARSLVMAGPVRRAPRGQSGDAALCGIVAIDPDT